MTNNSDSLKLLKVKINFWKKETLDLFDFESTNMEETEMKINNEGFITVDKQRKVVFENSINRSKDNISKILLKITSKDDDDFEFISPSELVNSELRQYNNKSELNRCWLSICQYEKKAIAVGDIIKLGRSKLKVDRIYTKAYIEDNSTINICTNTKTQNTFFNLDTNNKDKNLSYSK